MCILPEVGYHPVDKEGLSLFIALRWMQDPGWVMVWLAENIQACLRDFQTGTASMARKRHLASTARGFCGFCLMTLVTTGLIRSIRIIRGRKKERPILWRTALQAEVWWVAYIPRALPPVTQSSALQAPECSWRTGDEIALQAPECWWRTGDATTYPHRT